jgi:hypothetical protein
MLMGIGIVLAIVGIAAIFSNKRAFVETDHLSPVVKVPLLPLQIFLYFFLAGAFLAGFAAGLAAARPGL